MAGGVGMKGQQQWEYLPPRPGPRKRHRARRVLLGLGACVGVGFVIGRKLGS